MFEDTKLEKLSINIWLISLLILNEKEIQSSSFHPGNLGITSGAVKAELLL